MRSEHARATMRTRTVSNTVARFASAVCERSGMDPREFLRRTNLTVDQLTAPGGRVSQDQFLAAVRLLYQAAPAGLKNDLAVDVEAAIAPYPDFGVLLTNSPSFRQSLTNFCDFRVLVGEIDDAVVRREGNLLEIEYRLEGAQRSSGCAFFNLALLAGMAPLYESAEARVVRMELSGEPFLPLSTLKQAVGYDIRIGQPRNVLTLLAPGAEMPSPCHNPFLYRFAMKRCSASRAALWPDTSFSTRVENFLHAALATSESKEMENRLMGAACEHFRISRWTMQRYLAPEGTTFRQLLDRVRLQESHRHLSADELAISEISERLGFSSNSAFTRFFVDRCNQTPSAFRRRSRH
jgi:AraC-like DNA-binding protein